jgi:hypothetical protein
VRLGRHVRLLKRFLFRGRGKIIFKSLIGWVAERLKAPVLKLSGRAADPSPLIPFRLDFCDPGPKMHPASSPSIPARHAGSGGNLGGKGEACIAFWQIFRLQAAMLPIERFSPSPLSWIAKRQRWMAPLRCAGRSKTDRLNQRGILVFYAADAGAHRSARHAIGQIGTRLAPLVDTHTYCFPLGAKVGGDAASGFAGSAHRACHARVTPAV